jgi:hypothetical protein
MATTLSRFGYDELISALEDMRATFVRTGNWIDVPEKDFIALVHYTKRAVESEPFVLCFDDFSPFVMSGLAQFFGSFPHKAKVIISSTKMPAQVDENAMVVETVYRPGQVSPPPASVAHPKNVRSLLGSGAN